MFELSPEPDFLDRQTDGRPEGRIDQTEILLVKYIISNITYYRTQSFSNLA